MKLGAMMLAFRERKRILPAIKQLEGYIDKIVVACSLKPWYGHAEPDDTVEIARTTSADVHEGVWVDEAEQRNFCMNQMQDCDWVLITPPDRLFTKETLISVRYFLEHAPKRIHGMYTIHYWKNFDTVILPDIPLNEAAIPRFNEDGIGTHFVFANRTDRFTPDNKFVPGIAHHISWVKTDEEIKTKLQSYSHAQEIDPDWYDTYWKNDSMDITDFSPIKRIPGSHGDIGFKKLARYSLPDELKELYENFSHGV